MANQDEMIQAVPRMAIKIQKPLSVSMMDMREIDSPPRPFVSRGEWGSRFDAIKPCDEPEQ